MSVFAKPLVVLLAAVPAVVPVVLVDQLADYLGRVADGGGDVGACGAPVVCPGCVQRELLFGW